MGNRFINSKYSILPSDQLNTMGTPECIPAYKSKFRSQNTMVSTVSTPSYTHTRAPLQLGVHTLPRKRMADTRLSRPYNYRNDILNLPQFINQCCNQKLGYGYQYKYDMNHVYKNNSIFIDDTYTPNKGIQQTKNDNQPYFENQQQELESKALLKYQNDPTRAKQSIFEPNKSSYLLPTLTFHKLSSEKPFQYHQQYLIQTPRVYIYKPAKENEYLQPTGRLHRKRHSLPTYNVTLEHYTLTICHRCHDTSTPQWRRGPKGPNTLCNACGSVYAKLIRLKGVAYANGEICKYMVVKDKNGRRLTCAHKKPELVNQVSNQPDYMIEPILNNQVPNQTLVKDISVDKHLSSPISNSSHESLYTLSAPKVRNIPQVFSQPVYWIGD